MYNTTTIVHVTVDTHTHARTHTRTHTHFWEVISRNQGPMHTWFKTFRMLHNHHTYLDYDLLAVAFCAIFCQSVA